MNKNYLGTSFLFLIFTIYVGDSFLIIIAIIFFGWQVIRQFKESVLPNEDDDPMR